MTSFQKIIKYGAIAFGVYLTCMIISGILFVLTILFGVLIGVNQYQNETNVNNVEQITTNYLQDVDVSDVTKMDIEIKLCKLHIVKGDTFKIETSSGDMSDFTWTVVDKTIKIRDGRTNNWFYGSDSMPTITIYLPETMNFEEVEIELGGADTNIEQITSENFSINTGAGKCNIKELVAQKAEIDCGAGKTMIENATIGDLRFDGGIGKTEITATITNYADIDSGIGKLDIHLKGGKDTYKIKGEKGLGSFTVDGKEIQDNETIGNGKVLIEAEAGVGETKIDFVE